jgi:ABC-type uncharacterized transport system ATPase subunit
MTDPSPVVALLGITKRFAGVVACDRIDLDVYAGEIHALLGENGAGKTTLMKVLYGLYQPDAGEIWVDGRRATIRSPADAIDAGIGMVCQHFTLIPSLTVAENIALADPNSPPIVRRQALAAHIRELARHYRLQVEPDRRIWQLSVGEQQRVEILKLLHRRARLLIFDEPTAVLTPQEVDAFLHSLQNLTAAGHAIILITHKLPEALAASHRITVLRHGRVVAQPSPAGTSAAVLARAMLGRDPPTPPDRRLTPGGGVELAHTGVSARNDRGRLALHRVCIEVRRGEIVGIAGVAGNGQRELAEVVAGLRRVIAGAVHIRGEDMTNATPDAIAGRGVSYIPEDRLAVGLVPEASVLDNLLLKAYRLPPIARGPFLNHHEALEWARCLLSTFQVSVPRLEAPMHVLSGGNQQRLLLARELSQHPSLLIACSPTRGLDVGGVETMHRLLLEQRQRGCAILLISEDLDELITLADRIMVMYQGHIAGSVRRDEADVATLGLMMTGVQDALGMGRPW